MKKGLNILWIKSGPLHPLDSGGKIRTFNMLRELRKRHRITYVALASRSAGDAWKSKALEYCHRVISIDWNESAKYSWRFYLEIAKNMLCSDRPYAVDKYASSAMKKAIAAFDTRECDLMVCDFLAVAMNFPSERMTPSILFEHNVESDIWRRHYELRSGRPLLRWYFHAQWRRMVHIESRCCRRFDGVVTVSPKDAETLRTALHVTNVIGDVPAGVDLEYFDPKCDVRPALPRIIFIGSMDWLPNDDAVRHFIRDIYPKIKLAAPEATFTIAGRKPSPALYGLARRDESIEVTGTVEDIRPYARGAMVMVIPMRIGGGTRLKIFEGMAMRIPIVSTEVGAEGMPVSHGNNILLANDADSFAREVVRLLQDPNLREKIASRALRMVQKDYSWDAVSRAFESHCYRILSDTQKRRT